LNSPGAAAVVFASGAFAAGSAVVFASGAFATGAAAFAAGAVPNFTFFEAFLFNLDFFAVGAVGAFAVGAAAVVFASGAFAAGAAAAASFYAFALS